MILQSQRFGVNEAGSQTDELVDRYRSMIVVKKDSDIESLEDLKGKKWLGKMQPLQLDMCGHQLK